MMALIEIFTLSEEAFIEDNECVGEEHQRSISSLSTLVSSMDVHLFLIRRKFTLQLMQ